MTVSSPLAQLRQTFTSYWQYLPLYTACQLHVLDALQEGPMTIAQLTQHLQANQHALSLLLKALVELEILVSQPPQYALTAKGAYLTEEHPQSVKYSCLLWAEEHLTAWQQLPSSILTGQTAFEARYGEAFFDYLATRPHAATIYHRAMFEYARDDYQTLPEHHDFGQHDALLDVGGGLGAVLLAIHQRWPALSLGLFELPQVVALLPETRRAMFSVFEGSFFEELPTGFDAVVMSRILHDWDDAQARHLLERVYAALPKGGSLYILENLSDELEDGGALLSLNMLLICRSQERTLAAYSQLIHQVGFRLMAVKRLPSLPTLLCFEK